MARIFISYCQHAEPDRELARRLYEELKRLGHSVFMDTDIAPGAIWHEEIERALSRAELVVVLLSNRSVERNYLYEEVRRANNASTPIVPVRVRFTGELPYRFGGLLNSIQHAIWSSPNDDLRVISQIRSRLDAESAASRPDATKTRPGDGTSLLPNKWLRQDVGHCNECNYTVPPDIVQLRIDRGETTVVCPLCTRHIPIDELPKETALRDEQLERIQANAEEERARQARLTILDERRRKKEYHVVLCHNVKDRPLVHQLKDRLLNYGILAWVDDEGVLAGERFSKKLQNTIDRTGALAVLIGPQGMGGWQEAEYHAALQRSLEERDEKGRPRLRLIPVLLPGVGPKPELPLFLRGLNYIDLREEGPDNREQLRKLVEAITTKQDLF